MKENISCKEVMSHICESLGEDLNSEKCMAIREHLEDCPGCKNYFSSVEQTISFYKMYDIKMPDEAHNRLMEKLGL
jgi:predicted anti-sigma-YlaC factor YlaD